MLIVTVSPITDDVDEDVFVELLAILEGDVHGFVDELGLVGVYVDDGGLDGFGHVSAVEAGA